MYCEIRDFGMCMSETGVETHISTAGSVVATALIEKAVFLTNQTAAHDKHSFLMNLFVCRDISSQVQMYMTTAIPIAKLLS